MKNILSLFTLMLSLLLFSCSNSTTFTAEGNVKDLGTQNMHVIYYSNGVQILTVPVKDDNFKFKANLETPTIVEFYTSNRSLLGRAYVNPGDDIECIFQKGSPNRASIKGNDVSEQWSKFLNDNIETLSRGDTKNINSLISKYISSHKNDILSTLLLITEYITPENEEEASKLLSTISVEARPKTIIESYEALLERSNNIKAREKISMTNYYSSTDTLSVFAPHKSSYSILAFTNEPTRKSSNISKDMRLLRDEYPEKRLQIVEISFDPDTATWKNSIKPDSATWQQGWVVGGVSANSIDRLGISRLPFYIVADSTGKQLYRGTSVDAAKKEIQSNLK